MTVWCIFLLVVEIQNYFFWYRYIKPLNIEQSAITNWHQMYLQKFTYGDISLSFFSESVSTHPMVDGDMTVARAKINFSHFNILSNNQFNKNKNQVHPYLPRNESETGASEELLPPVSISLLSYSKLFSSS